MRDCVKMLLLNVILFLFLKKTEYFPENVKIILKCLVLNEICDAATKRSHFVFAGESQGRKMFCETL